MYAVKYGSLDLAKAFIEAGADYKAERNREMTAIDYVNKYKQKEMCLYLKTLSKD
jgi:hypothetical protein